MPEASVTPEQIDLCRRWASRITGRAVALLSRVEGMDLPLCDEYADSCKSEPLDAHLLLEDPACQMKYGQRQSTLCWGCFEWHVNETE